MLKYIVWIKPMMIHWIKWFRQRLQAKTRVRFQTKMSMEAYDRLCKVAEICETKDLGNVVSGALTIYEKALIELKAGNRIVVRRKDGTEVQWELVSSSAQANLSIES